MAHKALDPNENRYGYLERSEDGRKSESGRNGDSERQRKVEAATQQAVRDSERDEERKK